MKTIKEPELRKNILIKIASSLAKILININNYVINQHDLFISSKEINRPIPNNQHHLYSTGIFRELVKFIDLIAVDKEIERQSYYDALDFSLSSY